MKEFNYGQWANSFTGKRIALEGKINPPEWDNTSLVEKEAEVTGKIYIETLIYKAEKRAIGCGCRNCHKDAQAIKEQWG